MPLIMSRRFVNGSRISTSSSLTTKHNATGSVDVTHLETAIDDLEVRVDALEASGGPSGDITVEYTREEW